LLGFSFFGIEIEIVFLISAGDAVFLSTGWPEALDPVQADGLRSGCWPSLKPEPGNLSKGDKRPIFRVQVPFLFDPDFDLDFPNSVVND